MQKELDETTAVFEEYEKINELIGEQIKERNVLCYNFRQAERDFNAYLAEICKARQERSAEQRAFDDSNALRAKREELREERETVLDAVKQNQLCAGDRETVLKAVKQDEVDLEAALLRGDREDMLKALNLGSKNEELRGDREAVLKAVKQNEADLEAALLRGTAKTC